MAHPEGGDPDQAAITVSHQERVRRVVPGFEDADHLAHVPVGQLVLKRDPTAEVLRANLVSSDGHAPHRTGPWGSPQLLASPPRFATGGGNGPRKVRDSPAC